MKHKLGFLMVMEQGPLEAMVKLLVESIRRQPALAESPVYVVQPRSGKAPCQKTFDFLVRHQAYFIYAKLNQVWAHHALMNKIYSSALVERLVENSVETLIFLDSDVILIAPPDGLALKNQEVVGAAPVADWGFAKIGQRVNEPLTPYWEMLFEVCGIHELPGWQITTTVDQQRIFPYFNSGVIATRPTAGVFRLWQEKVERLAVDERARSFAPGSREFYFLEQASFSAAILSQFKQEQIRVLPHRYNYPLHIHQLMPDGLRASSLEEISFVHYHGHFSNLYWMDDFTISEPLKSWLMNRLPLQPQLRFSRGSAALHAAHFSSKLPFRSYLRPIINRIPGLSNTVPRPNPIRKNRSKPKESNT